MGLDEFIAVLLQFSYFHYNTRALYYPSKKLEGGVGVELKLVKAILRFVGFSFCQMGRGS